nr:hypothetical protein [uncultured Sediminibacterium sp.]
MAKHKSSFTALPSQIEWALPMMIAYITYVSYHKTGIVLVACVLTFAIMLNGWISSKATCQLYSDTLLAVDVFVLCMYLAMTFSLHDSTDFIEPKYWLCSSFVCLGYAIWDIVIKRLVSVEMWRKYFRPYAIYMSLCFLFHFFIYLNSFLKYVDEILSETVGIIFWVLTLAKWHYDKFKMTEYENSGK